ncbi:MAG: host specificity factor TipJ family phage tail protein [Sporomusaceae bacterium]|nr:host specificity factor TipJ family phage tail protein [Sporomusaceae bacterium]
MISVILIRNPIQPDRREKSWQDFEKKKSVHDYAKPLLKYWRGTKFVYSLNGKQVKSPKKKIPHDGDQIVLMPVIGKGLGDVLRSVAGAMLMGWATGLVGKITTDLAMRSIYLMGISYIGGRIINALLPIKQPSSNSSGADSSTTYGFDGAKSSEQAGTPIGKTFGTVSPSLKLIMRHVSTDGSNQYLNMLFCAGEGPLDSIDNIKIAGNDISNYSNVQYWTRLGTNDQEPIDNFCKTYADYGLSYELADTTWHTQTTEGTAVEGFEIMVELPGGLYYLKDDSSLGSASVTVLAQYKKVNESNWTDWLNETISGSSNSAIYKSFSLDNIPSGQYDVRMCCSSKSGTSTRYSTKIYWVQLSEIVYDRFCYPNLALLGIKIQATSQLSGSDPQVTCTTTRSKGWIWNPYTSAYEQKRITNPYWASLDLIHNCKYLKNINTGQYEYTVRGQPAKRIDYDAFAENADYSDETINGDYRFNLNLFLDTEINYWDALSKIALVGRGVVLPRGTKYSCICDKPAEITQLFSMGNITKGSFSGRFQGTKDRSKSVEITFYNKVKQYQEDTAVYFSADYDEDDTISNPVKSTYYGITDYSHAYREAAFLGRCNQYKKRTETWSADIDAIACMPGDVVALAHDIPRYGLASGRIVSATANSITLDKKVDLKENTAYNLMVRLGDDSFVSKTITVDGDVTISTLPIKDTFTVIPEELAVYSLGSPAVKPFKIISITKTGEQKCKLIGEEYFKEIYDDNVPIPEIKYSALETAVLDVQNLSVSQEVYKQKDGSLILGINVAWTMPRQSIAKVNVYYSTDNGQSWIFAGSPVENYMSIMGVRDSQTYVVKVCTVNSLGVFSAGVTDSVITGYTQPPPDVEYLRGYPFGSSLIFTWPPIDGHGVTYEIREGTVWELGAVIVSNLTVENFTMAIYENSTKFFMIKAKEYGVFSENAAQTEVTMGADPSFISYVEYDEMRLLDGKLENVLVKENEVYWTNLGDITGKYYLSEYTIETTDQYGGYQTLALMKSGDFIGFIAPFQPLVSASDYQEGYYTTGIRDLGKILSIKLTIYFSASNSTDYSAKVQYRNSLDGVTWTSWVDFAPCTMIARYLQFRVVFMSKTAEGRPIVFQLYEKIGLQMLIKSGTATVAAGANKIYFDSAFVNNPSVVITNVGNGVTSQIFDGDIYENCFVVRSNTAAVINWIATGS